MVAVIMTRYTLQRNTARSAHSATEPAYHVYDDRRRLIGEVYHVNPGWAFAKPTGIRISSPSFQQLKREIREAMKHE